jgi:hypothetical protein
MPLVFKFYEVIEDLVISSRKFLFNLIEIISRFADIIGMIKRIYDYKNWGLTHVKNDAYLFIDHRIAGIEAFPKKVKELSK